MNVLERIGLVVIDTLNNEYVSGDVNSLPAHVVLKTPSFKKFLKEPDPKRYRHYYCPYGAQNSAHFLDTAAGSLEVMQSSTGPSCVVTGYGRKILL